MIKGDRAVRGVVVFLVLALLLSAMASYVQAARDWDPLDAVTSISSWFRDLVANFDQMVEKEKRGQLLRSVDGLRRALYVLEADTQLLIDSVTDRTPTPAEHQRLEQNAAALLRTVTTLSERVRAVGADLRLADQSQVIEARLTAGLRTRAKAVTWVQEHLRDVKDRGANWTPQEVRTRLQGGLAAVRDAQLAATEFQARLAKD